MIRIKAQSSVWLTRAQKSRLKNINDQTGCCVINLDNKIPPPVIAIVSGILMWWISSITSGIQVESSLRVLVALLMVSVGAFFCLAGFVSFRRARTTVNPLKPENATALVDTGIYRISRNPMYLGFAFFLLGWAVYLGSFVSWIGVPAFVLYINRFQITPEERALRALFGTEFESYKSRTRCWL